MSNPTSDFIAWTQQPVKEGEDPLAWLDSLAFDAAWQSWSACSKLNAVQIAGLQAELLKKDEEIARLQNELQAARVECDHLRDSANRSEDVERKLADVQSWEVSSRETFQHIEELISGHDEFVCQDIQRVINQQLRPNGRDPNCEACHGDGEYLGHSPDCDDDLCALNGDMYSCVGVVVQCDCVPEPTEGGTT